jgi:tyrosyl-tRNA synthetase
MTGDARSDVSFLLRNVVECLPEGELARKLAKKRQLRVKLGIDPTAPDIHLGHAVVLRKLAEFQALGHTVVLIIGDYTGRVGDPSGRSQMRPELDPQQIDRNAETFQSQAFSVLDPAQTEVRRNSEWLDMPVDALFRLARSTTVAQLLERDDFKTRYDTQQPISVLELLYPLLQGYDSVAVGSDLELGGTDQKFNLLLARAIQQAYGVSEPQTVLTMPILPGTDGQRRMSKTLGNYIGVTDAAEDIFGKVMRIPDSVMELYYSLLLDEPQNSSLAPVESKRQLAYALTARFAGGEAAERAQTRFDRLHVERGVPDEIEEATLPDTDIVYVPALIAENFSISRSQARRLLSQGGVKIDGVALAENDSDLERARLEGAIIQIGKRRFRRFRSSKTSN